MPVAASSRPAPDQSASPAEGDVARLRAQIAKWEAAQVYDPATGLLNRHHFLDRLAGEFQRAVRYERPLALILMRVPSRDEIDWEQEEETLLALSQVVEAVCRTGADIAGRLRERDLGLLLPETGLGGALFLCHRLQAAMRKSRKLRAMRGHAALLGADAAQPTDFTAQQLLERATLALEASALRNG